MSSKKRSEVLVVGAGPVGLAAAALLAQRGISPRIIDKQWRASPHEQAIALHPSSLQILDELGLLSAIVKSSAQIEQIAFYEGHQRQAEVTLAALPGAYRSAAVLRQDVLEDVLRSKLQGQGVAVEWSHALASLQQAHDHVAVTIDKWGQESRGYAVAAVEQIIEKTSHSRAGFVIGTDGCNSTVRRALDLESVSSRNAQLYAAFEFRSGLDSAGEARVIIGDGITGSLWPLAQGWARWCFRVDDASAGQSHRRDRRAVAIGSESYPHLGREELLRFSDELAPWFGAEKIGEIRWSMLVRFEHTMARHFGRGRCWLAGDAAHLAGPAAALSVNRGLSEAAELSGRIAGIFSGDGTIDSLSDYNRSHTSQWRRMLGLENPVSSDAGASPWVRQHAASILASIPASGETLARLAGQLGLEVASG